MNVILSIVRLATLTGVLAGALAQPAPPVSVTVSRVPAGGLQARTVPGADGTVHLVYFAGDLERGDVFYSRCAPGSADFAPSVRVNSQVGSASAGGTIRGPSLALEPSGRAHVLWCGSPDAEPRAPLDPNQPKDSKHNGTPLLYSRCDEQGLAFEPQRNLMTASWALDGGAAIAADASGNVSAVWHGAHAKGAPGEAGRAVFVARSIDHGAHFAAESPLAAADDGACACCGLAAGADSRGVLAILYRRARENIGRDMALLLSYPGGRSVTRTILEAWEINACPMTTAAVVADGDMLLVAWETKGQITLARVETKTGKIQARVPAGGQPGSQKYPAIAVGPTGRVILTWADGAGWGKGGSAAWQVFDSSLRPIESAAGSREGLPAWTFPAPYFDGDGFVVLY